jgi:hypothetical protein
MVGVVLVIKCSWCLGEDYLKVWRFDSALLPLLKSSLSLSLSLLLLDFLLPIVEGVIVFRFFVLFRYDIDVPTKQSLFSFEFFLHFNSYNKPLVVWNCLEAPFPYTIDSVMHFRNTLVLLAAMQSAQAAPIGLRDPFNA